MMILCKKQGEAPVATEIEPYKTVDVQITEIVPTYSEVDSRHCESVVEHNNYSSVVTVDLMCLVHRY